MEATIGARVEEILARLNSGRERLRAETGGRKSAQEEQRRLDRDAATLEERVDRTREQLQERVDSRAKAVDVLRGLVATRLLAMLGASFAFSDDPGGWSMTRVVEVARELETALVKVAAADADWDSARRALNGRLVDLDSALARYGHRPTGMDEAGVHVVSIPWQGSILTVNELADFLDAEIDNRKRILDAREREILEQHLLGEISTQLHEHIRGGEELVAEMNKEVEGRAMSTGMRLKFAWKAHPDAPPGFDEVRARLLATQGTWSPSERQAIGAFLHARIQDVRARDDAGTWREQLTTAFDYRKWHRFSILLHQEGEWKPLNRRTHGTGSGGEKAVALTLPQVAAAAAHYRSAAKHAPRLILLDEVFVGIDNDMRSKCFGLLEAFDLDFVMTSEREWGCHATVPGLAIYQLTARAGIDAIHTTRFVWDGHERHRDEAVAT